MSLDASRRERRHTPRANKPGSASDQRSEFRRDRDRILYSTSFRRLALITQVVSPEEGHTFHNRLTHVIKVAQVGRHLAEKLRAAHTSTGLIDSLGGLDPDVVEAAALAHDLGHPPFGHLAEEELNFLASKEHLEGFEGNAQSFRVVASLEVRDANRNFPGLNLTRATLNAVLKYPCYRATSGKDSAKWGAYSTEKADFDFARSVPWVKGSHQTLEAALMDWADDIAYSVHDMDDFYRANRIPLWKLVRDKEERDRFLASMFVRKKVPTTDQPEYAKQAERLFGALPISQPFSGSRGEIGAMRVYTSQFITEFESATTLNSQGLVVPPEIRMRVELLKELVWFYVILDPALATQQHGQRRIIRELFDIFRTAAVSKNFKLFPTSFRFRVDEDGADTVRGAPIRTALDFVSSLTEPQAVRLHQRLTGINSNTSLLGF